MKMSEHEVYFSPDDVDRRGISNPEDLFDRPNEEPAPAGDLGVLSKGDTLQKEAYERLVPREELLTDEQETKLAEIVFVAKEAAHTLRLAKEREITDGKNGLAEAEHHDLELAVIEGRAARDELVLSNLRFAAMKVRESMDLNRQQRESSGLRGKKGSIVKDMSRLAGGEADYGDRMQAATIGLINAAERYDGHRGRFASYASYHIEDQLLGEVTKRQSPYSIPQSRLAEISTLRRIRAKIEETTGREAETDDLAKAMSVQPEKIAYLDDIAHRDFNASTEVITDQYAERENEKYLSLDDEEFERLGLADRLPDPGVFDRIDDEADLKILAEDIVPLLDSLTSRERQVIESYYGFLDGGPKTLELIGRDLDLTRERVRQILGKTLSKLRHPSRSEGLNDYLDTGVEGDPMYGMRAELGSEKQPRQFMPEQPTYSQKQIDEYEERLEAARIAAKEADNIRVISADSDEEWEYDEPEYRPKYINPDMEAQAERAHMAVEAFFALHGDRFRPESDSYMPGLQNAALLTERVGDGMTNEAIAFFWNHHLEEFIEAKRAEYPEMSLDSIGATISALLKERMSDIDVVELTVPDGYAGEIGRIGEWIRAGKLIVRGDVGRNAGSNMHGTGELEIYGSAGRGLGTHAFGYASIRVHGNAEARVAYGLRGSAGVAIDGDVGLMAGASMTDTARLIVGGNAGDELGTGMMGNATIEVTGNAGKDVGRRAHGGVIRVGSAKNVNVPKAFKGQVYVAGSLYRRRF